MRYIVFIFTLFVFLFSAQLSQAQRATYFNWDVGISFHQQDVTGEPFVVEGTNYGPVFAPMKWQDWMWGFSIEQEITKRISVVAGLRFQDYSEGTKLKGDPNPYFTRPVGGTSGSGTTVMEIPVGLRYNISLIPNLSVAPYVGWVFVPHVGYKSASNTIETGRQGDPKGGTFVFTADQKSVAPFWGLYEVGARVRYMILEPVSISAFVTWRAPVQEDIGQQELTYQYNDFEVRRASYRNNAQFLSVGVRGSFRLSYLWDK